MSQSRPGYALVFNSSWVARVHTICATAAFSCALAVGLSLHYKKIVKNGVAGWPHEWWPSVSATIGDWYPERNLFQILIALTSGPRFALVFLWWFVTRIHHPNAANIIAISGVIRTVSCGVMSFVGWVYITSSDDHDAHDVLMVLYMVCNIPWMFGSITYTPPGNHVSRKWRKIIASSFFGAIPPMIYFFIRHKVHRIPGAYTHYSFFEWWLIVADVAFDSIKSMDFSTVEVSIRTVGTTGAEMEKYGKRPLTGSVIPDNDGPVSPTQPVMKTAGPTPSQVEASNKASETTERDLKTWDKIIITWAFSPLTTFIADVYLSYCAWSVYTSLSITLFYFSVWELAISGSELAVLSTLSPLLLGIAPFRRAVSSHSGRCVTRACVLLGMASYALQSPLQRLLVVSFANMALGIDWAVGWGGDAQDTTPTVTSYTLATGFILANLSKLANHSNNPVWPIVDHRSGGWNKSGLVLALLSWAQFIARPPIPSTARLSGAPKSESVEKQTDRSSWWMPSVGLGATLFALHSKFADSGTVVAWSWTGYPAKGPIPGVGSSAITLAALGIGLALSTSSAASRVINHPAWVSIGAGSCFIMYRYRDWTGHVGGLVYGFFLMSILPKMVQESAFRGVTRVYSLAWLTTIMFILADVWATAYAFVPGGAYMRERTDIVLTAEILAIGCGALNWNKRALLHSTQSPDDPKTKPIFARFKSHIRASLGLVLVLAMSVVLYRTPRKPPMPHHAGDRLITTGIWTMHFGQDNEGRDSQRRMRDLIRDMELDVVGLLETDLHRIVFGNRDLTQVIVEELGYYVGKYLGPGPNSHTWGAVLLSKFPIVNSTHHLLPSPNGELAPAISAVIDAWGTHVHVVVSHNGQEEDPLDRQLQSQRLAEIMDYHYPEPTIFLGMAVVLDMQWERGDIYILVGYVVTRPFAPRPAPYLYLTEDGRMYDIDKLDWDRWCEYILYRGLWRVGYARVSRSTITDTELQVGKFVVPKHGTTLIGESEDDRYIRTRKEDMPKGHLFNEAYYPPNGKNGHVYHVFNYPLHYKIPDYAPL
ncbi:Frag1 domain-containing protein [Ceratobasidium sp. AG-Ba]|nr:Frag1 domain-containing protein [Ceratobasidium sp. AG-Ba]